MRQEDVFDTDAKSFQPFQSWLEAMIKAAVDALMAPFLQAFQAKLQELEIKCSMNTLAYKKFRMNKREALRKLILRSNRGRSLFTNNDIEKILDYAEGIGFDISYWKPSTIIGMDKSQIHFLAGLWSKTKLISLHGEFLTEQDKSHIKKIESLGKTIKR